MFEFNPTAAAFVTAVIDRDDSDLVKKCLYSIRKNEADPLWCAISLTKLIREYSEFTEAKHV